ncbi:MAG: putative MFS family arabinose efflux permease [Bacteroidia bacterium]|jgi:predicted MFS family arabinose efflux permease
MFESLKFWLPAASGMVCLALSAGLIGIYGFFVEPLSQEFGVGVAILNMGPVALLLVPGIIAPFVGKLADRLPIRRVVLFGVSLAMFSLMAISQAPTLQLVALGFIVCVIGLTGYGPVVINGLMVKLYPGREARSLAIVAIGISLATATLPPVVGIMLETMSWRATLLTLAVVLMVLLWLAVLLSFPNQVVERAKIATPQAEGFHRKREFWLIGWCVALAFNASIVVAITYPPYFMSVGYSAAEAGGFLSFAGICGLLGKTTIAWLGDKSNRYVKWLAVGLLLMQALGLSLLLLQDSLAGIFLAVGLMGFSGGAFIPMHPFLNSQYFDNAIISEVNGAQMPLFLPFGLVGAPLAGYAYDQTGNYELVHAALACAVCIAAVILLRLPSAQK